MDKQIEKTIAKLSGEPEHLVMSMESITVNPQELKRVIDSTTKENSEFEFLIKPLR